MAISEAEVEAEAEEGNAPHSNCHGDRRIKKRRRDEDEKEDEEERTRNEEKELEAASLEDSITFTDTLIALKIIRAQFPKIERVAVQPFVLRSQLYSSVKDRTQVDRELEALREEEVLRIFKLNTGQDDHAIMFTDDYLKQVEAARIRIEAKHPDDVVIFGWFRSFVLPSKNQVSISHLELCELLSSGGEVKDKHISLLINAGLLTRQLADSNSYWFSIPNVGMLLKSLSQGRKELLSFLNRRKYKEMLLSPLEKRRLRFSQLDMRFHLRDLIGSGHLKIVPTPAGSLVRVAKE